MCRSLQKLGLNQKKNIVSSQAATQESKTSEQNTGKSQKYRARKFSISRRGRSFTGLTRTHARSQMGTRVYALKPFYRGAKVTVIGAMEKNCGINDNE